MFSLMLKKKVLAQGSYGEVFYLLWGGLTVITFTDITGIILVFVIGVVLLIKTLLAKTKLG